MRISDCVPEGTKAAAAIFYGTTLPDAHTAFRPAFNEDAAIRTVRAHLMTPAGEMFESSLPDFSFALLAGVCVLAIIVVPALVGIRTVIGQDTAQARFSIEKSGNDDSNISPAGVIR